MPDPGWLHTLADGTVKQVNPFSGTRVWTVPGRGNRPLVGPSARPRPVAPEEVDRLCAFCPERYLETPPEKGRWVRDPSWRHLEAVPAEELHHTRAEFRRIPNLFEILTYDYWQANHGVEPPADVQRRRADYLATDAGREHVLALVRTKLRAAGWDDASLAAATDEELLDKAGGFFGGGHDVIVARRHLVDGATDASQLAASGTLSPEEHGVYVAFTLDSLRRLYAQHPRARYVAAFQNWLQPAGASFDHLHKQLVAIDEWGRDCEDVVPRLRANPDLFNEAGVDHAVAHRLVLAANEHAVACAGVGHRYPTVELYSRSAASMPWECDEAEVRGMSDLLHAMHAATGPDVPCNEEWHHRPVDLDVAMPWRINLKWRVSTLAGFEGGTRIYLNTISPHALRDRLLSRLATLRAQGVLGPGLLLGDEVVLPAKALRYSETP